MGIACSVVSGTKTRDLTPFLGKWIIMRWFPIAFPADTVYRSQVSLVIRLLRIDPMVGGANPPSDRLQLIVRRDASSL